MEPEIQVAVNEKPFPEIQKTDMTGGKVEDNLEDHVSLDYRGPWGFSTVIDRESVSSPWIVKSICNVWRTTP